MNLDRLYNESLELLEGKGIQKDEQKSFEINRTAAIGGHADATLAMGWFYINGAGVERCISEAITWYRRSARRGEPRAMFSLGFIAYEQKDWGDALTWFRRAADAGHHRSLFWIGKLHWRGRAVVQSHSEAMRLIHLAAKKKVPDATRALRWLTGLNKIAKTKPPAKTRVNQMDAGCGTHDVFRGIPPLIQNLGGTPQAVVRQDAWPPG